MSRKKVGLALGGGAARGLAHIGVLEVLEKEGIPIDMIAGTSMGAIIGGYYASKKDVKSMRPLAIAFGSRRMRYFSDFTIPTLMLSDRWPKPSVWKTKAIYRISRNRGPALSRAIVLKMN